MKIPFSHPLSQFESQRLEIEQAIAEVLNHGHYILGPQVEAFEREFTKYIGVSHGMGVANGTEALQLALMGCGITRGDEVITVSHTAVATVAAVEMTGATPVLVDIEPDFYCLDPKKAEAAITPKTKAIVAVHLYGQACDLGALSKICKKHGIKLIEDCAQAHGATYHGKRVGSIGDVAAFSFYPTKNLGAIGDGGMVVTSNDTIAERVRLLRQYGWKTRYQSEIAGINSRLDEIQAAILRVKLKTLDKSNEARQKLAALYTSQLEGSGVTLPAKRPQTSHVFHLYVVQTPDRDSLMSQLTSRGIGCAIHYPVPVHQQPAYRLRIRCVGGMETTERLASAVVSLPLYPELTEANAMTVVSALTETNSEKVAA